MLDGGLADAREDYGWVGVDRPATRRATIRASARTAGAPHSGLVYFSMPCAIASRVAVAAVAATCAAATRATAAAVAAEPPPRPPPWPPLWPSPPPPWPPLWLSPPWPQRGPARVRGGAVCVRAPCAPPFSVSDGAAVGVCPAGAPRPVAPCDGAAHWVFAPAPLGELGRVPPRNAHERRNGHGAELAVPD